MSTGSRNAKRHEFDSGAGPAGGDVDHRAGDIETGGGGACAGAGQKGFDDRLQAAEVGAGKFLLLEEMAWPGVGGYESQPRLGATDVASN